MTSCACAPAALTSVHFADGVVMLRCSAHDVQRWLVDGRPAEREDVLPVLRGLFGDRRGERRRTALPAPARTVVRMPAPPELTPLAGADDGERLTALLRARGLEGSWAVA